MDSDELLSYLQRISPLNELGMRESAVVMMKESVDHIRCVYDRLGELASISIPEVEQLIERLS
ncbi:MAG: hypothetical protein ACXADL_06435 [Candidatus Thorarchaeota archaeon]|jgi:hypothetical protein